MGFMLLAESGSMLALTMALLLAACAAAHVRTLAGMLHGPTRTGAQSPLVCGGQAASAVMTTGMVIMLLRM